MRTLFVVVLLALLSGCATNGSGRSFLDPDVVSSNERYITLFDNIGIPGRVQQMASEHCQRFGRIAQFQAMGGSGFQCGMGPTVCSTYTCVN